MLQRMGRTFLRSMILLSLLLILLPCVTDFAFFAVAESPDLHILDLLSGTDEVPQTIVTIYKHGFYASLKSRNFILSGRKVIITEISPSVDSTASMINQAVKDNPNLLLVLGPASSSHTLAALPALRKNSLVAFGPLSMVLDGQKFEPHFYFFFIGLTFTIHALLRHAVVNLRVRRLGFMYTTNVSIADDGYEHAVKVMHSMDRELCGVFRLDGRVTYKADDELFKKEWEAFAETRPQAVIIVGAPNSTTMLFVQQMVKDPRTNTAYFLAPSALEGMVLNFWKAAQEKGAYSFPGQVITTSSYPAPTDTRSTMIKTYRSVIRKYLKESGQTLYDPKKGIPGGRQGGSVLLAGWVAGEVLFQAISDFNPSLGREEFRSSLFNQRTYFIGDLAVGTFGGDISEERVKVGAVARCNQGASSAYMKKFLDAATSVPVPEGDFKFPIQVCYGNNLTLFDSAAIVTVNFTDSGPSGVHITNEVIAGLNAGLSFGTTVAKHDMALKVIQSPKDDVTRVVQKEKESHWTNILTGSAHDSTMDIPNLAFIDPIPSVAQLNKYRRNAIFLSPTMEQQLFVFAEYVASLPDRTVHAVIRSQSDEETLDVLKNSLLTFGVTLNSSDLMKRGDKIENYLRTRGFTIMISDDESDIPVFVKHLEQNTNAHVVVLFTQFVVFYDKFCAAFKGTAAADRLLVITNLPHWADTHSSSTLIHNYHESIRDPSAWSPLSLQNFIVGRVIRNAVDDLPVVNWSSVIQYFYSFTAVSLEDMSFGPFSDKKSVTCTSKSKLDSLACARNFGATSISVWSMSRVLDPSVPILYGPVNPSMEYNVPSTGLTRAQLIGVIVGSVVGAFVLIAALVLLLYWFRTGNTNAPKNLEDPVTLIFTDIQSSTALWATCPGIMPEALETHHRLIRRLIAKYKCYEVKTIGDSFMIACKSASAAVQLVVDLQRTFLQYDWGTSAIDDAYHEFEEQQAAEDADYKPPTARLDAAVYREYWSGLRVRAGVHTGLSDIRHDEVTKRYDYYGSTSNTAARTESVAHGGQVLLTGAAYMALSTAERAGIDVTALGPVELRGVPEPVAMYQLNAVPGRAFAKLRLDRECDEVDFETGTVYGSQTSGSRSDALSPAAENVLAMLQDVISPFPVQQRLKVLEPFCKRWNVDVPKVNSQRDVLAVSHLVMQRLAIKISRVIERRRAMHHGPPGSTGILSITSAGSSRHNWSRANAPIANASMTDMPSRRPQDNEGQGKSSRVLLHTHRDPLTFSLNSSIHLEVPPGIASARA